MRVTSGIARGQLLLTVEGESVRPTGDKVKQAVFSMLQFEIAGKTVLDLFSGSGQLGIEALSRGAKGCTFVDSSADSISVTKKNLQSTGLLSIANVEQCAYDNFLTNAVCGNGSQFDLVFLDPPYHKGLAVCALELLWEKGLLSRRAIVVLETDKDEIVPQSCGEMELFKQKIYRYTAVHVYRRNERVEET